MSEAFEAYRAGGRVGGSYAVGKTILGFLIALVMLTIGTITGLVLAIWASGLSFNELIFAMDPASGVLDSMTPAQASIATASILFATLFGLAWIIPGVWIAQRALHGRPFRSVLGAEGRLKRGAFWAGMLAAFILAPLSTFALDAMGFLNLTVLETPPNWALIAIVLGVLICFQAAAEEILFRGYLLQTLAARYRWFLIWGVFPSVLFAVLHFSGGDTGYGWYYIFATFAFGVFASALVWKTGGISLPIGYHIGNNLMALLIFESPFGVEGIGLLKIEIEDTVIPSLVAAECLFLLALYFVLAAVVRPEDPNATHQDGAHAPGEAA